MLRRQLCRQDIDHKLPFRGDSGKLKNQVTGVLGDILADQHHGGSQASEIARDREVLLPTVLPVDPNGEAASFHDHFLRTVAETASPQRSRFGLGPFFPQKGGLVTTSKAAATAEKMDNPTWRKPIVAGNLLLPVWNPQLGLGDRGTQRGGELVGK